MRILRKLADSRGTSTLEFVVVLPVLLFVLFSIVELSRAWLTLNMATAAAREGVRAGVVAAPDSVSSVGDAKINAMLGAGQWTGGVTCAASPCAPDQVVSATVTMQFQTVVPLILPAMFGSMNITQTASMRYE
jgi:Flp pilus assembly protein TadG